jgi:hypothetical protein
MLTVGTLTFLASQKKKDAFALLNQNRNSGAIYLMGYALELSFKRKICQTLGFTGGFPEVIGEYRAYSSQISTFNAISTGIQLTQLREIKNHKLDKLIVYSGAEYRIKTLRLEEWHIISNWNPEDRYKIKRYSTSHTKDFIDASIIILNEIS